MKMNLTSKEGRVVEVVFSATNKGTILISTSNGEAIGEIGAQTGEEVDPSCYFCFDVLSNAFMSNRAVAFVDEEN
jgi:coenzyme F420-reducing hydrogenase beta subunit